MPNNTTTVDLNLCTLQTCAIKTSYYGYVPNRGINIFFQVMYGLMILTCILLVILYRRSWLAYTIVLGFGAGLEFAGYNLRIYGTDNPWGLTDFTLQLVFLTIAPIFMSASVYLSVERIAQTVGAGSLKINPRLYPRIFIPSDVIALAIQSVGGAMSSSENEDSGLSTGVKITIVGLVLQLVSLCVVFVLFLSITIPNRTKLFGRRKQQVYSEQQPQDSKSPRDTSPSEINPEVPQFSSIRNFIIIIMIATFLIVVRSAYRVAELSSGLSGSLITNQWAFMIMDGLIILIATALLTWGHPNLLLRGNGE